MIIIVGDEHDPHCRHIANRVEAAGGAALVVDFARLADNARFAMEIGPSGTRGHLAAPDPVDFAKVETIWLRRPAMVRPASSIADGPPHTLVRQEWSAAVNGMAMAHSHLRWVNDPFAQNAASKPLQLHRAREAGLPVPDTLITNDPQLVRGFLENHTSGIIHKALTALDGHLLDTRAWDDDRDGPHLDSTLPVAPAVFQERVRGSDIRSVVMGDTVLSVEVDATTSRSTVDARLDMDAAYRAHDLPPSVADAMQRLMAALGLVFGVIDLKLDDRGQYVFLEINPQGQFLFMEILTGIAISDTLAAFLLAEP